MYDSLKPVVLTGTLEGSFLASFLLGWGVTTGSGIASYPLGEFDFYRCLMSFDY